jgi:DNA-binding NarL/FixJ family response regulator
VADQDPESQENLPDCSTSYSQFLRPSCRLLLPINQRDRIPRTSHTQSGENMFRSRKIAIMVIDTFSFTRECITLALSARGHDLTISSCASCDEASQINSPYDLFVFHIHEEEIICENNQITYPSFKFLINLAPVIVLSPYEDQKYVKSAFEHGAYGYIPTKSTTPNIVIEIIRFIKSRDIFAPLGSPLLRRTTLEGRLIGASTGKLTPRERDVLALLQHGKANKVIAYELRMSESTVRVHIRNILKKLNVSNRTEAVCRSYAMKFGTFCAMALIMISSGFINQY